MTACLVPVALAGRARLRADEVDDARAALYAGYADRLEELALWCDSQQMARQARLVREWLPKREPGKIYLFVLDDAKPDEPQTTDPPAALREWEKRFADLRTKQAVDLFALAGRAVEADRFSLARMLLTEVVRENPEHEEARRALGYVRTADGWRTAFARRMNKRGYLWHERFGWIPTSHVSRYESGLRKFGTRWLDAQEEARQRAHITNGWRVETDHYDLTTNHSLEEGVRLALRLERLQQVWRQLFPRYYASPSELENMLAGNAAVRRIPRQHRVIYYRSRDQYNEALRPSQPRIDITLGIYFDNRQCAYFFAGEQQRATTLYHEGTHQLFQESRRVAKNVGRQNNFWIVEGIATYFETLTDHDGYLTLGGANAGRLPAARERALVDGFYIPFAELTAMSMQDIQSDPRIARLYSQAAGQAAFLMHAGDGRYRDALVRYLTAVYTGTAQPDTLATLTGTSYETLDRQYRDFLRGEF